MDDKEELAVLRRMAADLESGAMRWSRVGVSEAEATADSRAQAQLLKREIAHLETVIARAKVWKRPTDANQLAKRIVDIATDDD